MVIKGRINRKALLSGMSILFMLVMIVLVSLFQAGLDPNFWKDRTFWNDMMFITGIIIFGVVSGNAEGDNFYRTKPDGLFVYTYNAYEDMRTKIDFIVDKFRQWSQFLYRREYSIKVRNFLVGKGITQHNDLLGLDRSQIMQLGEPREFIIDGKNVIFKSLNEEQMKAVLFVLDGKLKFKRVADDYFLNAYAKGGRLSMYERAGVQEQTKRKMFTILLVYRVILNILIGGIFAGLVIQKGEGHDMEDKFIDLISRLFALITAIGWGFYVGNEMVKEDTIFLDYKKQTLHTFYIEVEERKTFVPLSIDEEAKEEYTLRNKNAKINASEDIKNDTEKDILDKV